MKGLRRVKSILEFNEKDREQGVERNYIYYNTESAQTHTSKQEVDIISSPYWKKMLFLDGTLQSTIMDEVIYHNALVHPLMDVLQNKEKILILGGGGIKDKGLPVDQDNCRRKDDFEMMFCLSHHRHKAGCV
jgi:predicted membrane-bound spermidine synthase